MNLVSRSLDNLKWTIPKEVLDLVFNVNRNGLSSNVLHEIEYSVLRPRILVDANLVGGSSLNILLSQCSVERVENYNLIVRVPKRVTNNRTIISAENINSGTYSYTDNGDNDCGFTDLTSQAYKMVTNSEAPGVSFSTNISVIGENTLYIRDYSYALSDSTINVTVANMKNLENIPITASIDFNNLVMYGVQAHIYNELRVNVSKGSIYNGHSLGALDEVVDSYSDSNNLYLEELTDTWNVVSFISDTPNMSSYVRSMFGNT